jgi:hypothetical protein
MKVQVLVFNITDFDYVEPMNLLGIFLASSEQVASGVTDKSGLFETDLVEGKYFLSLVDYTLSPTTNKGIPYLLDYPVNVLGEGVLMIRVEIDSSEVVMEVDIPDRLKVNIQVVLKP